MSKWPELPFWAWDVLVQLRGGSVFDGDLISKSGRDALIAAGFARRDQRFHSGAHCGCQRNELTDAGMALAMRYAAEFRPSNN
jgi:hypothetical protein